MAPRLLVIGASGFVGSRWVRAAAPHFDVMGGSRGADESTGDVRIDITDPHSVARAFDRMQPQSVTLLAALSDIDRAEREPELANRINVQGAIHVAGQCAARGVRLLYTSTDAVFDGTRGLYREDDPTSPPNVYGQTKARAEREILHLLPSALVVRLSLVLGTSALGGGNSYLEKVRGNLRAGNPIISPTYEYRNPIDVETLCAFLLELTANGAATGIVHVGASDKISRYDLARALARTWGADESLIVAQQEPVPGRAPRGHDDFLATDRLRALCTTAVPNCAQVIARACRE